MTFPISNNLKMALDNAEKIAIKFSAASIGSEQVLFGLASVEGCIASKILKEFNVSSAQIAELLVENQGMSFEGKPSFTARVKQTINNAVMIAQSMGESVLSTEIFLFAMLEDVTSMAYNYLTIKFGVDVPALMDKLKKMFVEGVYQEQSTSSNNANLGENSRLPAQLESVGTDITRKAREHKIDPIIGRQDEIERIIQILCRKTKNNPVLIGEPGVGKSAVVEGLARAIVEGRVPDILKDKIIFSLDIASIMAGTQYRGAMEEKLKETIETVKAQKNIVLFIDELHTLAQAGSQKGEVSPADILKPYLARGEMQTIGATTTEEYRKFIEEDKALERRFQPIMVNPPSVEETIEILKGLKESYENYHNVKLSDQAIKAAAVLSDRYIMDRFLPDKAIDLIDEAMSKAKVNASNEPKEVKELQEKIDKVGQAKSDAARKQEFIQAAKLRDEEKALTDERDKMILEWSKTKENFGAEITEENIASIVSQWTKIPVNKLSIEEKGRLVNLEQILHERVIGQDKAIESVARAIRRARAGLKDPNRPIGSFIFLGPTGVGKTELTKAISEAVFDSENNIIRLDMSEYMESSSVSKLIGSAPGYVGYDDGGQLTEQVRRRPYSVILFDEIEKAHSDIFNALLQILDEGRLTDSQGRTVSFKNTVIIMTSNVGVENLKNNSRSLGFSSSEADIKTNTEEVLMQALKNKFKPEFLNRIDVISIFEHLTKENVRKIADIMIAKVCKKLAEKDIKLNLTETAMEFLVNTGYDAEYGARPLRRVIERNIEDNLAEMLLDGRINDGQTIAVDCVDNKIVMK